MKIIVHYTKWSAVIVGAIVILALIGVVLFVQRASPAQQTVGAPIASVPAAQPEGDIDVSVAHDPASSATLHTFTVTLNTHSGDLSTFDAQTNIVYLTSQGSELAPASIGGDRETHHRIISVTFANTTLPGTLVVKNLRGVPERPFPFTQ